MHYYNISPVFKHFLKNSSSGFQSLQLNFCYYSQGGQIFIFENGFNFGKSPMLFGLVL